MAREARGVPILLLAATAALLAVASPAAAGDLVADAGASELVHDETAPVEGAVHGADETPDVQWSLQVDGEDRGSDRFADPGALETSLNVTGLGGDVTLVLNATDPADGDQHEDTVVYHVGQADLVLDVTEDVPAGVPDEIVGASGTDQANRSYDFTVPPGTGHLEVVLDWDEDPAPPFLGNDFDLRLETPAGDPATGGQGATIGKPERVTVGDPAAGTWTATVQGWLNGPDTIHLTAETLSAPPAPLPNPRVGGPYHFGAEDDQRVHARTPTDATLEALGWDLDDDGHVDASTRDATASRPPGTHQAVFHAREASHGYEARAPTTLVVDGSVDHAYDLNCGGSFWQPNWTMEWAATKGTCWFHGGHHTYFLGGPYTLEGGSGTVFSVESQLSPPRSLQVGTSAGADVGEDPSAAANGDVDAPIHVEASLQGQEWTEVGIASYDLAEAGTDGLSFPFRQRVDVQLEDVGEPFQYLRIHQPRSTAEGLSGFLDASDLTLRLDEAGGGPNPDPLKAPRTLTCQDDILEDFFRAHPCTFGGANRYDAPSFLHTYPLPATTNLSEVHVDAAVAPWRTDDYALPLFPNRTQVTETRLHVETSVDGTAWTTHAKVPIPFGVPSNATVDVGQDARFVRLHADYHPFYDRAGQYPSLHHPEGYMLHSQVRVVPAGGPSAG